MHIKRSNIKIAAAKPLKSGFKVVQFKMAPFDIRLSIHSKYSSILRFILRLPEHSKFSIFNSCTFGLMCQRDNFKYSVADNRVRIIRRRVELNCVAINGPLHRLSLLDLNSAEITIYGSQIMYHNSFRCPLRRCKGYFFYLFSKLLLFTYLYKTCIITSVAHLCVPQVRPHHKHKFQRKGGKFFTGRKHLCWPFQTTDEQTNRQTDKENDITIA